MAAKGLLSLYREVGAELLHKRDRGKDAAMGIRAGTIKEQRYGEEIVGGIDGIELLAGQPGLIAVEFEGAHASFLPAGSQRGRDRPGRGRLRTSRRGRG